MNLARLTRKICGEFLLVNLNAHSGSEASTPSWTVPGVLAGEAGGGNPAAALELDRMLVAVMLEVLLPLLLLVSGVSGGDNRPPRSDVRSPASTSPLITTLVPAGTAVGEVIQGVM
jgi:hypothetical protein